MTCSERLIRRLIANRTAALMVAAAVVLNVAPARRLLPWMLWTAGFVLFPIAGLAGRAVSGPVDDLVAAVLGGAVTGLVLGAGQSLLGGDRIRALRWTSATTFGMAAGLGLGSAVVGYGTSLTDLVVMGVLTGTALGIAQALALPAVRLRWTWALATPVLWGLGWTITTSAGIDVESQYTIFGMSGAVVYTALSGLLLHLLLSARPLGSRQGS